MKILVVDDEPVALTTVRRLLRRRGLTEVDICDGGCAAVAAIRRQPYDIVLLDLLMPDLDGMQVLEATKPFVPETEFVIITAVEDTATAFKALRLGAYDYLVKPVDNDRLVLAIERAYERKGLRAGMAGASGGKNRREVPPAFAPMVSRDPRMHELLGYAAIMAKSGVSLLITGESGTGKELLARGIHRGGPAPAGPFVAVNVSSIPESLFESQFFGHVKGAFTGAHGDYPGFFEQAHGGTLFLDEIGELPLHLQAKLLRALEEKTVTRIGQTAAVAVDVRIVSATNQDLDKACQRGRFRLDLMYRLKSAHIHLPPLRERDGDIPLLAERFLAEANRRFDKAVDGLAPEALDCLQQHDYPGNVRELKQRVESAVLVCEGPLLRPADLGQSAAPAVPAGFSRRLCTLKEDADAHVAFVLVQAGGDRHKAAAILGISLRQVQRRLSILKADDRWAHLMQSV